MRAASPAESGQLSTQGFRISYEVTGDPRAPAVLLLPTWQIAPSLHWKLQVPYLARSFRVATFDPPGIGGAERTAEPAAFRAWEAEGIAALGGPDQAANAWPRWP